VAACGACAGGVPAGDRLTVRRAIHPVMILAPMIAVACASLYGVTDVPNPEDGGMDGSGESGSSSGGGPASGGGSRSPSATSGSRTPSGSGGDKTGNDAGSGTDAGGDDVLPSSDGPICAQTCNGCCDSTGACHAGGDLACGLAGVACIDCATRGQVCRAGTCAEGGSSGSSSDSSIDGTACNDLSCGGCCTAASLCAAGGLDNACGRAGAACKSCSASGMVCGAGSCVTAPADAGEGGVSGCNPSKCTNVCVPLYSPCCKTDQSCGCALTIPTRGICQ
jgi:hypothetical protein